MTNVAIRTRLTVLRDGSTSEAPIAFCAAEGRSVPLARCASCGFATRFVRGEAGRFEALDCRRVAPRRSGADESGDRPKHEVARDGAIEVDAAPVAIALGRAFVCFAADAPLAAVAPFLETTATAFGHPVVDDRDRLVGTLARGTAALALARARRGERTVGQMVIPSREVSEGASLARTFASMRERGAQEAMVVDGERTLVGVLRDIDALRVVARLGGGLRRAG